MQEILIICEEPERCANIKKVLTDCGYQISLIESSLQAIEILRKQKNLSFVLLDSAIKMIKASVLIQQVRSLDIVVPIILMVDKAQEDSIEEALSLGANDYIYIDAPAFKIKLAAKTAFLYSRINYEMDFRRRLHKKLDFSDFVSKSVAMRTTIKQASVHTKGSKSLLIEGESGTGREDLARVIHAESSFSKGDFILLQSLSFSQEKNAQKQWFFYVNQKIKEAAGGTLCIFGIEHLTNVQQKELEIILQKSFDKKKRPFRLISLSSIAPEELITKYNYSSSLLNLLAEARIFFPPLRQRKEDLPEMAQKIVRQIVLELGLAHHITGLSGAVVAMLLQYHWPGNVMQLQNVLYRAILTSEGPLLTLKDFSHLIDGVTTKKETVSHAKNGLFHQSYLKENGHIKTIAQIEREVIEMALKRYNYRMSEVARRLQLGRSTLYRKLEEYNQQQSN